MTLATVLDNHSLRQRVLPLSVRQYHSLGELGLLPPRTELIEGMLIEKMPKSPLHEYLVGVLHEFFQRRLPGGWLLRKKGPLTLSASEPEPDLSIVRGRREDFLAAHPHCAELVIEVAVSSLDLDREKALIYAQAGIPAYWIVQGQAGVVEVYGEPGAGGYRSRRTLTGNQSLSTPWGTLPLSGLFPAEPAP